MFLGQSEIYVAKKRACLKQGQGMSLMLEDLSSIRRALGFHFQRHNNNNGNNNNSYKNQQTP